MHVYMCAFIHSGYFYSASSSPLKLRGAPDTAQTQPCRSFAPKRPVQLRVKDLSKVPTWLLERYSNPRPFGRKAANIPISHLLKDILLSYITTTRILRYISSLTFTVA